MADLQSILNEVKRLREAVETLPGRINVSAAQVTIVNGLSDLSEKLGLIQAGEFRSGNRVSPGDGFSGVRIGYPGFTYGGSIYNIAGVDADTLMFGLRSSDGAALFGGGNIIADVRGMIIDNNVTGRIWFRNSSNDDPSTGVSGDSSAAGMYINSGLSNYLSYVNQERGAGHIWTIKTGDSNTPSMEYGETDTLGSTTISTGEVGTLTVNGGTEGSMIKTATGQIRMVDDTGIGYLHLRNSVNNAPNEDNQHLSVYMKNKQFVIAYNDTSGTTDEAHYWTLDLTSTASVLTESTDTP